MVSIREIISHGAKVGSLLEITLFEDTKFDSGWHPAPTVDPQGFARGEETSKDMPKGKCVGYVYKFEDDRVFLSPTRSINVPRSPMRIFYVEESVIHSYCVME